MRCRLSIVLLMLLLAGCASPDSTVEIDTFSSETETPTLTLTPTASPIPASKTPRPSITPYPTRTPTYNPFAETTIRYQEGVPPLTAHRRLGMGFIRDLQISPDRQSFAVGTTTGVYVFDSQTYDLLWSAATRAPVEEIKWSPSGDKLAATPMDTADLLLWDANGQFIKKFERIGSFDWSPDGEQIVEVGVRYDASEQRHSGVVIWNVDTGEKTGFYEMDTSQDSSWHYPGQRWSPNGRYIAVGMESSLPECPQLISVLDLATEDFLELAVPEEIHHRNIKHLEFSPDGSKLLSYSGLIFSMSPDITGSSHVVIWDVDSHEMLYALKPEQVPEFWQVADVGWSPDGRYVAAVYPLELSAYSYLSYIAIWDTSTGENLFIHEAEGYFLDNLDWSPDGANIIFAGYTTTIGDFAKIQSALFMVDLSGSITVEKKIAHPPGYSGWLSDDKLLLASRQDLYVRDMPTNRYTTVIGSGRYAVDLVLRSDSPTLAVNQGSTITDWDIQTWERLEFDQEFLPPDYWLFPDKEPSELELPAHYTYILDPAEPYGEGGTVNIKLLTSGRTILDYADTNIYVFSSAVSMDDRYIAFGFGYPPCNGCPNLSPVEQAYILLFDTETETYVTLYGHTGQVTSLLFLPDGDLVSGSADGTIVVWDIP